MNKGRWFLLYECSCNFSSGFEDKSFEHRLDSACDEESAIKEAQKFWGELCIQPARFSTGPVMKGFRSPQIVYKVHLA